MRQISFGSLKSSLHQTPRADDRKVVGGTSDVIRNRTRCWSMGCAVCLLLAEGPTEQPPRCHNTAA